jgi:hypothetical protein
MRQISSNLPAWVRNIVLSLPLHAQVLLTGNVRDLYPFEFRITRDGTQDFEVDSIDVLAVLWHICKARGYVALAVLDVVTAKLTVRTESNNPKGDPLVPEYLKEVLDDTFAKSAKLSDLMVAHVKHRGPPVGLVIPYAARLASANLTPQEDDRLLLARAEAIGHSALPTLIPGGQSSPGMTPYNTIFWLCERQEELHPSFAIDSSALRLIPVPYPTLQTRASAARGLFRREDFTEEDRVLRANALAEVTHGMTVREVMSCGRLARDQGLSADGYGSAARLLQIGTTDDPWSASALRKKIKTAEAELNKRVIGQERAVAKTVDILVRSAVGLNGAHMSSSPNRPRGVLFLSGPTGVGKTELAKGIASLVLGKGTEPVRFDMSEFRADHAHQRLIGAPPGYVGYDVGGELTNAVRANPICVLLFDEIEKAHPRIFDLFLQILEDGRLTDGRGATVYFTECFLVFTSNLGTTSSTTDDPSDSTYDFYVDKREEFEAHLRTAFEEFFNNKLQRPEMRNRFGDSFVALSYIDKKVAPKILAKALEAVEERVTKAHGCQIEINKPVLTKVTEEMEKNLADGGRGIGNVVESLVVNPLARRIFEIDPAPGSTILLTKLEKNQGRWNLEVELSPR